MSVYDMMSVCAGIAGCSLLGSPCSVNTVVSCLCDIVCMCTDRTLVTAKCLYSIVMAGHTCYHSVSLV